MVFKPLFLFTSLYIFPWKNVNNQILKICTLNSEYFQRRIVYFRISPYLGYICRILQYFTVQGGTVGKTFRNSKNAAFKG